MKIRNSVLISIAVISLLLAVSVIGLAESQYNFAGKSVTYVGWWNVFEEISDERISAAEEEFNCTIELHQIFPWIEPYGEGIMSRLLSGESTYDIWSVQNMVGYFDVMPQEALYPLEDILPPDYYESFTNVEIQRIEAFDHKGHRYAFGQTAPYANGVWLILYNKSLLERIGTANPYELYKEGDWTWDALTQIAKDATADTDGDGEVDRYGLSIHHNGLLSTIIGASNGAQVTVAEENGRRIFTFDQEPALQAINQVNQWVNNDKIMGVELPDNPLINGHLAMQVMLPGGMADVSSGGFHTALEEAADEFIAVPIPMGPNATEYAYASQAIGSRVLPANVAEPEALLALDKYLFRGQEDVSLDEYIAAKSTNRETAEVLMTINENYQGETNFLMEGVIGGILWGALDEVFAGEKSAAAALNEVKPEIQAVLDDLFLD